VVEKRLLGQHQSLIYQVPLSAIKKDKDVISNIIRIRDSIGKLYITGTEPNTNMITEAYARISSITFDSKKPETEGNVGIKQ
jgi:hypothetical protein